MALLKSYQLDDAGAVHAMQLLIRLTTQDPNTFDGVFNENRFRRFFVLDRNLSDVSTSRLV